MFMSHQWNTGQVDDRLYSLKVANFTCCFYGCEIWPLTAREEQKVRVFENRKFRRIFGPKRDQVTGEWRKLHNEKVHNLYSSPNIIRIIKSRRIKRMGHVSHMEEI
jgi:hypothetical protein